MHYLDSAPHTAVGSTSSSSKYKPAPKQRRTDYRSGVVSREHYQHEPFPTGPSTLVYKPTPISELNKLHRPTEQQDKPSPPVCRGKRF